MLIVTGAESPRETFNIIRRRMNMFKKVIAIMTATVLAASMLVACGGSTGASSSEPAAQEAAEPAAEEAAEPAAEPAADAAGEAAAATDGDLSTKKVGVCIYQFSDNFMTLFRTELEKYLIEKGFAKENITIVDGANDQATQSGQIDSFIADGVDVLIINLVNSSSASTVTDKVVAANIPLVYINREPAADEQQRWADNNWNVCYVGCDARQSGTYQGEIIGDLGLDAVDFNKNGKIDYIMIKGDPENVDAQYRTEFSIKALTDAGFEVNKLDEQVGMWDQVKGAELVANSLSQYGNDIEVVFCNNDAMALGALQSIQSAGRKVGTDIYLVGVDALTEVVEYVISGDITGTVFNDHFAQSHNAADAAINYITGAGNEHNIQCDYKKVTQENAQEILDSLQ
jgi:methyl-galactoside transport system substrate-binding protein